MKHYLWALRPYFRQTAGELVLGSVAGIVMNTAVVLPPLLLGRAIDAVLAFQQGRVPIATVAWAIGWYVLGVLASEGPRILKRWWLMTANARIRASIRSDLVRGILATPLATLHATTIGDLMARVVGDVEVLGVGVREFIIETWDTVLFSFSLVVAMAVLDARLAGWALLPTPLAFLLGYGSGRWVSARTKAAREVNATLTATVQEQLTGVRVFRLFGHADTAVAHVSTLADQQAAANLAIVQLRAALEPCYQLLITAGVVLLIWQGGLRVVDGALTIGTFVAFFQLYARFIGRGFRIPQLINSIQSGGAAYTRIRPWLATVVPPVARSPLASFRAGELPGQIPAPVAPASLPSGPIAVVLDHVTFTYPGAVTRALHDITLTVPTGSFIAITGPVGSGKSALAQVLLGLLPRDAGIVLLDGQSADTITFEERALRVGSVPQEPFLFSGSVVENMLLTAPDQAPTLAQLAAANQAIAQAGLAADVRDFAQGIDTLVGELGVRVSGGQRQRIVLARALAAASPASPGLLILDDPFSAVDVDTESQIIAALYKAFGPRAPRAQRATIVLI